MSFSRFSPLVLAACLSPTPSVLAGPLGAFTAYTDLGSPTTPGKVDYALHEQTYTLSAGASDHGRSSDQGVFVYRPMKGDFIAQGLVELSPTAAGAPSSAGFLIRQSLATPSASLAVVTHRDGSTSIQFRRNPESPREEFQLAPYRSDSLQISRHGSQLRVSAARMGDTFTERAFFDLDLKGEVFVGFFASTSTSGESSAHFRNVRLIVPAPPDFAPYRDYIGSHIEILDTTTGHRRIVHWVPDSLQAPNWTPDNRSLIYNHNGRIGRFDLASGRTELIPTGDVIENNNDHALSADGRWLGLSSGQPSRVYTVPVEGGTPRLITPTGPSYLHGWSPDGRSLVFTGGRNGNYDIYSISAEGGPERRLTTDPALDDGSEYTPDGRHILFISNRSGTMQIWRMRPDGSEQIQLTRDEFQNWFPHPSPDGRHILFLSYRPEIPSGEHPFYRHVYLRQMPIEGGEARVVAYFYGGQGSINVNSWSPDSRLVAFVSNTVGLDPEAKTPASPSLP